MATTLSFYWPGTSEYKVWKQSKRLVMIFLHSCTTHTTKHQDDTGPAWTEDRSRARVRWNTFKKRRKKINYCPDALSKRPSSCSEHSASCSGRGWGGGRGGEVRWYKRWTQCLWRPEPLEFVVPRQSFAEVGRLAADKQVVLFHNFFLGQAFVLAGDRTDIVNCVHFGAAWSGACC